MDEELNVSMDTDSGSSEETAENAGTSGSETQPEENGGNDEFSRFREFMQKADRGMAAFDAAYPNVDSLPDSVIERIVEEDVTPVEAYQAYLLELKDIELNQLKKARMNMADTPGSASGGAPAAHDEFLREFTAD